MRIAVDGRSLAAGRGIARYTRAMLGALAVAPDDDDCWRVVVPGRRPVDAPCPVIRHRLGSRALFGAAAVAGRPRLDRLADGADVVWAPAPAPLAVSRDVPLVVTFHDLSWLRRARDFTGYERLWHRLARTRALAERAAAVIAVSAATRDELVASWGLPPEKVVVVRSGPGLGPGETAPPRRARPYFLSVGALEPRKAPDLLARAHALARRRGLAADLVFAGDGRLAGAVRGDGREVTGWVGDAQLRGLYADALAVVHPALLEGFGFAPVEGLLHGTPAVVADLPVHRETVGDGALRVPAGDERALAEALLELEREPALRERLAAAGARAVSGLSWERAALETRAALARARG